MLFEKCKLIKIKTCCVLRVTKKDMTKYLLLICKLGFANVKAAQGRRTPKRFAQILSQYAARFYSGGAPYISSISGRSIK